MIIAQAIIKQLNEEFVLNANQTIQFKMKNAQHGVEIAWKKGLSNVMTEIHEMGTDVILYVFKN